MERHQDGGDNQHRRRNDRTNRARRSARTRRIRREALSAALETLGMVLIRFLNLYLNTIATMDQQQSIHPLYHEFITLQVNDMMGILETVMSVADRLRRV